MQLSYERNTEASIKSLVSIISASFILNNVLEACSLLMHSYSNAMVFYITSNEDLHAHKASTKNHSVNVKYVNHSEY